MVWQVGRKLAQDNLPRPGIVQHPRQFDGDIPDDVTEHRRIHALGLKQLVVTANMKRRPN